VAGEGARGWRPYRAEDLEEDEEPGDRLLLPGVR
jgi:hypothetical protein